eukprot:3332030-Amphidinium_carterae.1
MFLSPRHPSDALAHSLTILKTKLLLKHLAFFIELELRNCRLTCVLGLFWQYRETRITCRAGAAREPRPQDAA